MAPFLAAVVQMTSTPDVEANWESARTLIEQAAAQGAKLVATPENTNFLGSHEAKAQRAEPRDGTTCRRFADLARHLEIFLLLGSFNERGAKAGRCYNTSMVFSPSGECLGAYRKIHLFDVDLSSAVCFVESATVQPGDDPCVVRSDLAVLGLTICYDLRFPELYRHLVSSGAEILTVPSAFTCPTGRDHWLPLLQARAIENQCFVLAPGQVGHHEGSGGRQTYGHSVILDPWGDILAMADDGPGIALAEIDLERLRELRSSMPVLEHRRLA